MLVTNVDKGLFSVFPVGGTASSEFIVTSKGRGHRYGSLRGRSNPDIGWTVPIPLAGQATITPRRRPPRSTRRHRMHTLGNGVSATPQITAINVLNSPYHHVWLKRFLRIESGARRESCCLLQ